MSNQSKAGKKNTNRRARKSGIQPQSNLTGLFSMGAMVLATLREPREKFWGALLALDPAGLSLQGIELSSFEDSTSAVVAGEPLNAAVLFFPMHRVERIELDLPEGNLPSLSQRFKARTGQEPQQELARGRGSAAGAGA